MAGAAGLILLLSGCAGTEPGTPKGPSDAGADPAAASRAAAEEALAVACTSFWGDPDYVDPLSRTVLAHAASAAEIGPSDPEFFALTGDAVDEVFEGAPDSAQQAATTLADWFRTEPARGAESDPEAFRGAWEGLAGTCSAVSEAAAWAAAPGEDGTKPAALVCADVFDTPGTLTHFANANVLTSNMFKLVGRAPREVPADRGQDVRDTAELLAAEIAAVDDDAVRDALDQVRAPFLDALEGDSRSDGLQEPLSELATACEAVGYSSPGTGEIENDAVVGAAAETPHGTPPGGDS